MMNLCAILTMFCIEGICLLRLLFGPLSESWCWWLLFFNQSVPIIALLVFDAYYLARVSKIRKIPSKLEFSIYQPIKSLHYVLCKCTQIFF